MKTFTHTLKALLQEEAGQAMNSSASFLCACAVLVAGVYYYGGDRLYSMVDTVMHSPPPGTSDTLFH